MPGKTPAPICKTFLICKEIEGEKLTLIGKENCHLSTSFPSAEPIAFFARMTSFHGPCRLEVQLHDENGEIVWRWKAPEFAASSPLHTIEIREKILPVFPASGEYNIVLIANGEEVGREPFTAREGTFSASM